MFYLPLMSAICNLDLYLFSLQKFSYYEKEYFFSLHDYKIKVALKIILIKTFQTTKKNLQLNQTNYILVLVFHTKINVKSKQILCTLINSNKHEDILLKKTLNFFKTRFVNNIVNSYIYYKTEKEIYFSVQFDTDIRLKPTQSLTIDDTLVITEIETSFPKLKLFKETAFNKKAQ